MNLFKSGRYMNYFNLDNTEDYVLFSMKAEIFVTVGAYTSQNEFIEFENLSVLDLIKICLLLFCIILLKI